MEKVALVSFLWKSFVLPFWSVFCGGLSIFDGNSVVVDRGSERGGNDFKIYI